MIQMITKSINFTRTAHTRAVREEFQKTCCNICIRIAFLRPCACQLKALPYSLFLSYCKDTKFLRQIQIFRRKNAVPPHT
jgi:hypothetical protein